LRAARRLLKRETGSLSRPTRRKPMNEFTAPNAESKKWKAVYTIVERDGERKPLWVRIGTAWPNRDSSMNVKLDATPCNGQLHIRDYEPFDANRPRRGGGSDSFPGMEDVS
jgi:hypothetical protein